MIVDGTQDCGESGPNPGAAGNRAEYYRALAARRGMRVTGERVQCSKCGTEQHAECVKYDTTDPYRGLYSCPHCWVTQVGSKLLVSSLYL